MSFVFLTAFGPFERFLHNPSADVVRALCERPPPGLELASAVLSVSFKKVPVELGNAVAALERTPDLYVGFGVQSRGDGQSFRLERRAVQLKPGREDVEGTTADEVQLEGERSSRLDVEHLVEELERAGAPKVVLSEDAGGYVCEQLYHHLLGAAHERGAQALFVHLPNEEALPVAEQIDILRRFLPALVRASLD